MFIKETDLKNGFGLVSRSYSNSNGVVMYEVWAVMTGIPWLEICESCKCEDKDTANENYIRLRDKYRRL